MNQCAARVHPSRKAVLRRISTTATCATFVPRDIMAFGKNKFQEIASLTERKDIWQRLLATFIRPVVTARWRQKALDVLEQIVKEVRCYAMKFDQSSAIASEWVESGKG
jgi:hypothetical protein